MERLLMAFPTSNNLLDDEYDEGINIAQDVKSQKDSIDDYDEGIDMSQYVKSKEAEEATWVDSLKEAGFQAAAGLGQAFTYPLDILKIAMIGEGLTDLDELEDAFAKAGKPFDRNKYVQTVMEQGEFIPTQALLERKIDKQFGTSIENPKTKTGKFFNKAFFLGGLLRGKGLGKAAKAGAVGATTTATLREAGAPEIVSELAGDLGAGVATLEKQARKLSPEAQRAVSLADKRGLPLTESMLKETLPENAKITPRRKKALEKKLGSSSEQAIQSIIEEKIPAAQLRKQGQDTNLLEDLAYDYANNIASKYPQKIPTKVLVGDIDAEINRIKSLAPSPSDAQKAAIRILEDEKTILSKSTANAGQLIQQTRNYNSNVKAIYRKAEYSGVEDEVKNAYAFLNSGIRKTIEKEGASEVVAANRAANTLFAENSAIARSEGLITKAFQNGGYNPKKLNQLLNNKNTGAQLRSDLGEDGVKELKQIAEYGEKAQKTTTQFANSAKHKFKLGDWGPLAGFVLAKVPLVGTAAVAAKPLWDYVRGYMLTRPASRKAYANIVKNAANGSFSNMAKDFAVLESQVNDDFGGIDEFIKQGIKELQFYREGEEDED